MEIKFRHIGWVFLFLIVVPTAWGSSIDTAKWVARLDSVERFINSKYEQEYRAILVGLEMKRGGNSREFEYSMEELSGLADAAGVTVIGEMTQALERPDKATLIGPGKVEELSEMVSNMEADMVIFNDELSGIQLRNLEDRLDIRVIDRTILILDIFAGRAESREGKLQVELAQLQYRLPRLTGFGKSLSRLGGGIGTRGPGEKKLETDRRHIQGRIDDIRAELKKVAQTRATQRSRREKSAIPVVALVGYTNAGKSAIMNAILALQDRDEKAVKEKDMLFATLDTSQRSVSLENGREFILIDTVGFVSGLPHSLVKAFKATLEEAAGADLLLHVVDSAYENHDFQIDVTEKVLGEIGAVSNSRVMVYNKADLRQEEIIDASGGEYVCTSAKLGTNISELLEIIERNIFGDRITCRLLIPYDRGDIVSYLNEKCNVLACDYIASGTEITAEIEEAELNRFRKYIVND